jgi:peptidoglycan/LPS O-acetylase OafA/YrhL
MGQVSYSAYLLHFALLIYIGKLFRQVTLTEEIKFLLLYFVTVGIIYYFATWTYHHIELSFMGMGGRISKRIDGWQPILCFITKFQITEQC